MANFTCPRCGYKTALIGNLHKHFNRKRECTPKLLDIPFDKLCQFFYSNSSTQNECSHDVAICSHDVASGNIFEKQNEKPNELPKKYKCKYCNKSYNHSSSMYKHMKREHNDEQKIETDEQSGTISTKNGESVVINDNSVVNNTTNNTTNQIFIIQKFGNENIDYITDDYIQNRLKQPKQGINDIIRQIHFNPGRPENHNIKITNKKLPYVSIFSADGWQLEDKKKIINQIINKSYCIMDNVYNDRQNILMPSTRRQFENFQTKFDENDSKLKKDLERNTELQILNEQKVHNTHS